jgi:hypothetical protein
MAKELNEDSSIKVSVKTLVGIALGLSTIIGMWFALQSDIEEAKELPAPPITRIEYEMKDELIRNTILNTQKEVSEIKEAVEKIEDKLYDR